VHGALLVIAQLCVRRRPQLGGENLTLSRRSGHWRYLEHDWVAKPGTFIYEPAGEAHTLVISDDSPEPAVILFMVEGGLIYLEKSVNGGFAAYEDGFTALELTRKYYREANVVFCDGHVESPTLRFLFQNTSDAALVRWNRDHLPHRDRL